jgi:hypothetical protein
MLACPRLDSTHLLKRLLILARDYIRGRLLISSNDPGELGLPFRYTLSIALLKPLSSAVKAIRARFAISFATEEPPSSRPYTKHAHNAYSLGKLIGSCWNLNEMQPTSHRQAAT